MDFSFSCQLLQILELIRIEFLAVQLCLENRIVIQNTIQLLLNVCVAKLREHRKERSLLIADWDQFTLHNVRLLAIESIKDDHLFICARIDRL